MWKDLFQDSSQDGMKIKKNTGDKNGKSQLGTDGAARLRREV